jgi:hypothetical protein
MSSSGRRQIFVSHDSEDISEIEYLVQPLKYFPFEPYVAIKEHESGELKRIIDDNLRTSEVLVPFITDRSVDNRWVNQEVGFAKGQEMTIVPVFEESSMLSGFLEGTMGVKLQEDEHRTIHGIVSKLRHEFSPLGGFGPDWYVEFICPACDEANYFGVGRDQRELLAMYDDGRYWGRTCNTCRAEHRFNPASFHYEGTSAAGE